MGAWIEMEIYTTLRAYEGVAPYMGAWIEISINASSLILEPTSHPTWVRGLKLSDLLESTGYPVVAPYMGAWIEIEKSPSSNFRYRCRTLHGCVD